MRILSYSPLNDKLMHDLRGPIFVLQKLVFKTSLNNNSDITNFFTSNPYSNEYFRQTVSSKFKVCEINVTKIEK